MKGEYGEKNNCYIACADPKQHDIYRGECQ
jgi:hypothetical protein